MDIKKSNTKRNCATRPMMSPCLTKIVSLSFRGNVAFRNAGSHHFVEDIGNMRTAGSL